MGPSGPTMRMMFAGVKLVGTMFLSKVTLMALLVPLSTRLSAAVVLAAGLKPTLVLTMCGPGMINGRVSWL